jgi:hypothetical protein
MRKFLQRPVNQGEPWSQVDLSDLRASLEFGDSVEQAAELLRRSVDEVAAKLRELDLSSTLS